MEIPVCYGEEFGPDLEDVANLHALQTTGTSSRYTTSRSYHAYFLGFAPGFAYLGDLPKEIATPRLETPRKNVPPGSVGIAGRQTAVYPYATPGGWRLIGRTPIRMFRADRQPMAAISIGDKVKFRAISREDFAEVGVSMTSLVVESPGLLTTVQDLGRPGFGPLGVSPSGAADPVALRLGNVLVGNEASAAALEMTLLAEVSFFRKVP